MTRVLVVEDDQNLAQAYGLALQHSGMTVDLAENGIEALAAAEANLPDVILLDMLMPKMNGVEFLKNFHPGKHPDVIILVFSNMVAESTVQAVQTMGVTHYLTKSHYTPTDIVRLVQELRVH